MIPGRIIALAAAVSALAVAASTGTSAPAALEPAPPPAICRVAPDPTTGWQPVPSTGSVADLSPYQDYRAGLDMAPGLNGAGVEIADVEYAWRAKHVELAARGLPAAPPNTLDPAFRAQEHGTAVLGILGATVDGQGVSGLVPEAELSPFSPFANGAGSYEPALAIAKAADGLEPGDVLLIELQAFQAGNLVPIESIETVRNAIRTAVDRGIVVVEPAGNGNMDVGDVRTGPNEPPLPWLSGPNAPGHSGALMVGAGGSDFDENGASERRRVSGSNFGARVDVQGIGAAVVTSGYGERLGGSDDRAYTACFDGTSSASATVAGAVAALQSAAIARTGSPLSPAAVRSLLIASGLPQAQPAEGAIGPRPQVGAALDLLQNIPPPPPPDSRPSATTSSPSPVPAPPAVGTVARKAPAVGSVTVVIQRRPDKLVIRFKGLARSATVTVAGRRMRVVGGKVVVPGVRVGRLAVKVTAPRRAGVSYSTVWVRVIVPARGVPRIVRI